MSNNPKFQAVHFNGAILGEWTIKMRMIFGGSHSFEFDLPSMTMDPKSAEELVEAFRAAVLQATQPEEPRP
jgi:hypothetical protein